MSHCIWLHASELAILAVLGGLVPIALSARLGSLAQVSTH